MHVAVLYCNGDYAHGNNCTVLAIGIYLLRERKCAKAAKKWCICENAELERALFP